MRAAVAAAYCSQPSAETLTNRFRLLIGNHRLIHMKSTQFYQDENLRSFQSTYGDVLIVVAHRGDVQIEKDYDGDDCV